MDRAKLKSLDKYLPRPSWLEQQKEKNKRILLIAKNSYVEHRKVYKAGFADTLRLIRNELTVLRSKGSIAVWRRSLLTDGRTEVLFAVFNQDVIEKIGSGVFLLIPETWALASQLQYNKLYRIEGQEPYWAMLAAERLHIAPIKGLMQQKQFFLDAIGLQGATVEAETFSPQQNVIRLQQLPWQQLIGMLVWVKPNATTRAAMPWKKIVLTASAVLGCYALILSAGLVVTERHLHSQVQQLQGKANVLFAEQEQQARKKDALLAYQQEFERLPPISKVAARVTQVLIEHAEINRIEITGSQIQVRGNAKSATEILALLAEQPYWQEVRFIEDSRRNQDSEQFAISMVLKAGTLND